MYSTLFNNLSFLVLLQIHFIFHWLEYDEICNIKLMEKINKNNCISTLVEMRISMRKISYHLKYSRKIN